MAPDHNERVGWLRFVHVTFSIKRSWTSALVGGVSLIAISNGSSQDVTAVDGGKPASQIVGDTGAPYNNLFRPLGLGGTLVSPKIGPGQGSAGVPILNLPRAENPFESAVYRPSAN